MFEALINFTVMALQLGLGAFLLVALFLGCWLIGEVIRWWFAERKRNAAIKKYLEEIRKFN